MRHGPVKGRGTGSRYLLREPEALRRPQSTRRIASLPSGCKMTPLRVTRYEAATTLGGVRWSAGASISTITPRVAESAYGRAEAWSGDGGGDDRGIRASPRSC